MSDRLRLGIVGAGAIAQVGHLPALKRVKEIDVVGICDNDLPKARALADRFGIPDAYGDIEELVEYDALDAVLICTPNHLHESHIQAAIASGLHVFVERPLALTAAGAIRLTKAATKHARVVMVGANQRYRPDVQQIRSFVKNGELGDLESIRAWWFLARSGRASLGWRQKREQAGGGAMLDLGLGLLDLALWMAGYATPQRVSAIFPEKGREKKSVEQSGTAMIALEGGTSIHLDTSWRFVGPGERFGMAVRATRGSARINPLAIWKEFHGVAQDVAPSGAHSRETPFAIALRAQWAHFVAAIREETPPPSLGEQVTLVRVMEAIYQSAESGRDVVL